MRDERLSDLALLTMERKFNRDFEKVVDIFAKMHKKRKNSRIMLI